MTFDKFNYKSSKLAICCLKRLKNIIIHSKLLQFRLQLLPIPIVIGTGSGEPHRTRSYFNLIQSFTLTVFDWICKQISTSFFCPNFWKPCWYWAKPLSELWTRRLQLFLSLKSIFHYSISFNEINSHTSKLQRYNEFTS